jgi:RNA polymerase I-specific transcription initiation factor RRN7
VIATKLSQPFDDVKRNPWSLTDPSTTLIGWSDWSASFKNDPIKGLNRGEEVKITDHDVLHMSENMLDDYLNWYQKVFIDDRDPACMSHLPIMSSPQLTCFAVPQQILDLFPIAELAENIFNIPKEVTTNTEKLKRVNERLIWQKPLAMREDEDESVGIKRPGELYTYYRKVEEISEKAKPFYERAGKSASHL